MGKLKEKESQLDALNDRLISIEQKLSNEAIVGLDQKLNLEQFNPKPKIKLESTKAFQITDNIEQKEDWLSVLKKRKKMTQA